MDLGAFTMIRSGLLCGILLVGVAAPAQTGAKSDQSAGIRKAEASVRPENIRAHVKFISDDLFEGRYPGLRGGELAAKYIATQFALYGLQPAGDNGTYLQQINFVGMKVIPGQTTMSLVPKKPSTGMSIDLYSYDLKYGDDYTVSNQTLTPSIDV